MSRQCKCVNYSKKQFLKKKLKKWCMVDGVVYFWLTMTSHRSDGSIARFEKSFPFSKAKHSNPQQNQSILLPLSQLSNLHSLSVISTESFLLDSNTEILSIFFLCLCVYVSCFFLSFEKLFFPPLKFF